MRDRFDILNSLEQSYLSVQQKVTKLKTGGVIKSLLYVTASELERLYVELERLKRSVQIRTATGEDLDTLIEGLVQLKRRPASNSFGYVMLELGEPISTDADLQKLKFSFVFFDPTTNSVSSTGQGIQFQVNKLDGTSQKYYITHPLLYNLTEKDLETDPVSGEQYAVKAFKELVSITAKRTGKPVKYLFLPVVAESSGAVGNLGAGDINTVVNLGLPTVVTNSYYPEMNLSDFSYADPDSVVSLFQGQYVLGDNAFIGGGSNVESDEEYRERFYLFLNSLSRGTFTAIEFAIKSSLPNVRVKALESGVPGVVNVYVDSPQPISRALLSKISETVDEYKSAGILVQLRPTKVKTISVLLDLDAKFLDSATELSRSTLGSYLNGKDIGQTLSYTEIHELLDLQEISKIDSVFYGQFFTPELYSKFYNVFNTAYGRVIEGFSSLPEEQKNYAEIYQTIASTSSSELEKITLFYATRTGTDAREEINYPLVNLVRNALAVKDFSGMTDPNSRIAVKAIQSVCSGGQKPTQCLKLVRTRIKSVTPLSVVDNGTPTVLNELRISLKTLLDVSGRAYVNYFQHKLLTVPVLDFLTANEVSEKVTFFVLNDVRHLSYEDLSEIQVSDFERLRLARNFGINQGLYKDIYAVGTRLLER